MTLTQGVRANLAVKDVRLTRGSRFRKLKFREGRVP